MNFSILQPIFPEFNRIVKKLKLYHSFICQPASLDFVVTIVVAKFVRIWQYIFSKIAWYYKKNYLMLYAVASTSKIDIFRSIAFYSLFYTISERFSYILSLFNEYILFFLINRGTMWVSHLRIIRVLAEFLAPLDWQMTAIKYRNSISASTGRATFCENTRSFLEHIEQY